MYAINVGRSRISYFSGSAIEMYANIEVGSNLVGFSCGLLPT